MTIARLVRGANTLDLSSYPYGLGTDDFMPPGAGETYITAPGTALNRYLGAELIAINGQSRTWSIGIRVLGNNSFSIEASVRRLSSFVRAEGEILYLEIRDGSIPEPLWGQFGAALRYEIAAASVVIGRDYASTHNAGYVVNLEITIMAPYAQGKAQQVASATGAVFEDTVGSQDGSSKGLRIMPAVTNKMTNPVFGNILWNTNWTDASNIIELENRDLKYCFPGSMSSAFLQAKAATNNIETQSINVGGTSTHYFAILVARPDGAAVTTSDVQIYYNAALTTTFRSLGNGIYLGTASATGINAATNTGVIVYNGRSVYLMGMYCGTVNVNWIGYGDMLGWAWTSGDHESTSTATVAQVSIPVNKNNINISSWAAVLCWKPDFSSTNADDRYLFAFSSTMYCYYESGTDDFRLTDGSNTADTTTATFSAGDELVIIACGGPSGLALYYYNATSGEALTATNATYTVPANPTSMYLGSTSAAASHCDGIIRLFQTYAGELTSTEAGDIYTALRYSLTGGVRPGTIPLLWTSNGDNIVENNLDTSGSTGAPHYNYAVAHGISGDAAPKMKIIAAQSSASGNYTYLANWNLPQFLAPKAIYLEESGSADVTASGGAYKTGTGTSYTVSTDDLTNALVYALNKREVYGFFRVKKTGTATESITVDISPFGSSQARTITVPSGWSLWHTKPFMIPEFQIETRAPVSYLIAATFGVTITASASVTYYIDYCMLVPGPVIRIASGQYGFSLDENGNGVQLTSTSYQSTPAEVIGDALYLYPGQYNTLISFIGSEANDPALSYTMTYSSFIITPRWSLL